MKGLLISIVVGAGLTLLSADPQVLLRIQDMVASLAGIIHHLLA